MYRRALSIEGYEGLLLRRTYGELEDTHLRKMAADESLLKGAGVAVEFRATAREMRFGATGALVKCGHLDDAADLEKHLSTEYDDIVPDEASRFPPGPLFQIAARARSSKVGVMEAGGPWFRPLTNPGGPSARRLVEFFVDHAPDFSAMPEAAVHYNPDLWRFVPSTLEDNPYLAEGYASQLAMSHLDNPVRYRQLRFGDWRVIEGQFFSTWRERVDGAAWHVRELDRSTVRTAEWGRGMDWGRTAPGVVGWYLLLPEGRLHRVAEYKFIDQDIPDVAKEIRRIDHALGLDPEQYRYSVCDRALFGKGSAQDTGEPIAEQFARLDGQWLRFRPSISDRMNGWERCRSWLRADELGPRFTVDPSCRYFIRTIPMGQSDATNPEDLDLVDDHAMDEWRYFVMSRPAPWGRPDVPVYPVGSVGAEIEQIRADLRAGA